MIIVTGGTGMLGSHILYKLCLKYPVVKALKRSSGSTDETRRIFSFYSESAEVLFNKIQWENCDMNDTEGLREQIQADDIIIHSAAMVSFRKKDTRQMQSVNVEGTEKLVNICLEKEVRKLCHISSVAALSKQNADNETDETIGEMSPGISEYSKSKYQSEMEVWRGISEGLNAVIVNPSVIIGPGKSNSGSGALFAKAMEGNRFYTEGVTGFVDVNDVAEAIISLTESGITGERFILNGDNISYKNLFESLAKNLGQKAPQINASKGMMQTAAFFEKLFSVVSGKSPRLSPELIRSALSKSYYSNTKISRLLNINFAAPEESVKRYAPYYLNKHKI